MKCLDAPRGILRRGAASGKGEQRQARLEGSVGARCYLPQTVDSILHWWGGIRFSVGAQRGQICALELLQSQPGATEASQEAKN